MGQAQRKMLRTQRKHDKDSAHKALTITRSRYWDGESSVKNSHPQRKVKQQQAHTLIL